MRILRFVGYALVCLFVVFMSVSIVVTLIFEDISGDVGFSDVGGVVVLVVIGVMWLLVLWRHPPLWLVGYAAVWLAALGVMTLPLTALLTTNPSGDHYEDYVSPHTGLVVVRALAAMIIIAMWALIVRLRTPMRWTALAFWWWLCLPLVITIGLGKLAIELIGRWNVLAGSRMRARGAIVPPRGLVGDHGE